MPRPVTENCPLCGATWTQDWEDPPEWPRCNNGEICAECGEPADYCLCGYASVPRVTLAACLDYLRELQAEWSWKRETTPQHTRIMAHLDGVVDDLDAAMCEQLRS